MSSETLQVKKRDAVGSLACRKLRATGEIPANLYGHGEENVNLSVCHKAVSNAIKHGSKLLNLQGDINDTALLREVQWDAFGIDILHVDLTRVSKSEKVEVTLQVEMHGEAPGVGEGGLLSAGAHEVTIRCAANDIPESLRANVSKLHVGDALHAEDIQLPEGAELVTAASEMIAHVVKPAGADTADEGDSTGAEPEVINKGKSEEEGE